jgi:hypothetical protein
MTPVRTILDELLAGIRRRQRQIARSTAGSNGAANSLPASPASDAKITQIGFVFVGGMLAATVLFEPKQVERVICRQYSRRGGKTPRRHPRN